jgi:hypothetical protein
MIETGFTEDSRITAATLDAYAWVAPALASLGEYGRLARIAVAVTMPPIRLAGIRLSNHEH